MNKKRFHPFGKYMLLLILTSISFTSYSQSTPDWVIPTPCNLLRPATDFHIQIKDSSTIPVHGYGCNVIGDMNGDGIPEIAVASSSRPVTNGGVVNGAILADSMLIFNGANLNHYVEFKLPAPYITSGAMAMARGKVGGVDSTLLIVALQDKYLYAYNSLGVQVWKSDTVYTQDTARFRNVKVSVADINGDGNLEIVADNGVFNFDGKLLLAMDAEFPVQQENWDAGGQNSYVLADVDGDQKLEYICASEVYKFTFTSYSGTGSNSMSLFQSLPSFKLDTVYPRNGTGAAGDPFNPAGGTNTIEGVAPGNTAVADMTGDGKLDVIVNNVNGLYVWNPRTGTLIDSVAIPMKRFATPFTGDINGSHVPNILFCSIDSTDHKLILAYKFDRVTKKLSLYWTLPHTDESGATGMTLFDFNADGIMEICYRDENNLRIINGSLKSHLTGADTTVYNYASILCGSSTQVEYPTVADVDGSGSANLIVVGNSSGNYADHRPARLSIYSSVKAGSWAWARPVWNQYMYNAVNVNQDLSIPTIQMNPATWVLKDSVSQGILPRDSTVADSVQPYNSFFQQHSLESAGKYIMIGAALTIGQVTQTFNATKDSLVFSIPFTNSAQLTGYPATDSAIAFYCGDTSLHNVLWVGNMPSIQSWRGTGPKPAVTATVTVPISVLQSCGNSLTVVLNDKGNGTNDPSLPGECDYSNQTATSCILYLEDDYETIHLGDTSEFRVRDNDIISGSITAIESTYTHLGTTTINGDSTVTYTSNGINIGVDTFGYIVMSGVGCLDSAWTYVTILNNDTIVPGPKSSAIGADYVVWKLKDLASYTQAIAPDTAHVTAFDTNGVRVPKSSITSNTTLYNNIIHAAAVGTYPMTYISPDTFVTANVLVFDNDTITPSPTNQEAIGANDFTWIISNLGSLTAALSKDTAHVMAIAYDGTPITPTSILVNKTELDTITAQTAPGQFPLTFTTPKGTSVTVQVTLQLTSISADNVVWKLKNLASYTQVIAPDTAHVIALDPLGLPVPSGSISTDTLLYNNIVNSGAVGTYPMTYMSPYLSTTANVLVFDNDTITPSPTNQEAIGADNFTWLISDLGSLTAGLSKDTSHVTAYAYDGTPIALTSILVDTTELDTITAQTTPGQFPLTFTTPKGTSVTVIVNLRYFIPFTPDFSTSLVVLAVPMAPCNQRCDDDIDYTSRSTCGLDTMKNTAELRVVLQGNHKVGAIIRYQGMNGLYSSSIPQGGTLTLVNTNNTDVGVDTIVRNLNNPDAVGYLHFSVEIAGTVFNDSLLFSNDFDKDGVPNAEERSTCLKRYQGIFNEWHYDGPMDDRDGDGIPNIVEAGGTMDSLYLIDSDGDCIPNFMDEDSNGDGVPDAVEKFTNNTTDTTMSDIYVRPAISPNRDGLGDDQMYIENINKYPTNKVTLFDRLGHILYIAPNYNNQDVAFSGFPNQGVGSKKELVPIGTYYYYVEYLDATNKVWKKKSGFVEVRY